jgi:amino acid transporter
LHTTGSSRPQQDSEGLHRGVGFLGLLWSSEGSLIGSGWLFGALTATTIAGPSALIGWAVASVIVLVLALIHAELGGMFPVAGGTSRFPHYAFGSLAGGTFGWMAYIQAAAVAPIEVLAAVEYLSSAHWASSFYNASSGTLHGVGWVVAIGLLLFFVVLNALGVRWFARINNGLTTWKILIPLLTIVVLLATHFHGGNFSRGGGFFIHGSAVKSILVGIPSGGIVFSLLGFEQAVQLAGEARNPQRDVPRAVILSILIGCVIYILVQVAFIAALNPALLEHGHTWTSLAKPGHSAALLALNKAPFYSVAKVAGLTWLALLLRIDAVASPSGTGLIYMTVASRISYGLGRNGYVPQIFERTNTQRVPLFGIVFAFLLGCLFLLPFPSWSKLVNLITEATVLMYAGAPLALGALRLQKPDLERPFHLRGERVWAPVAFLCSNLIVYWAGWTTYSTLMVALLIGYFLFWLSATFKLNEHTPKIDWQAAPWLAAYLIGMGLIAYFGTFGPGGILGGSGVFKHVLSEGGNNDLGLYGGLGASAGWSLVIYFWALSKRLPESKVDEYVKDVFPAADTVD